MVLPYNVIVSKSVYGHKPGLYYLDLYKLAELRDDEPVIIKPYLRPLSSMTKEEKTEFRRFITWMFDCDYQANTLKELLNGNEIETDLVIELFDWLNTKHFDYLGLIPMGFALPAPEGMYNN